MFKFQMFELVSLLLHCIITFLDDDRFRRGEGTTKDQLHEKGTNMCDVLLGFWYFDYTDAFTLHEIRPLP